MVAAIVGNIIRQNRKSENGPIYFQKFNVTFNFHVTHFSIL